MSWLNVLVPFATGFAKGFIKEYTAPPRAPSPEQFAVVDSGSGMGWQWVAVPKAHARTFKAAHPGFGRIINFLKIVEKLQRKQPADFRIIEPFVLQVCAAVETYDGPCELFIRRVNG